MCQNSQRLNNYGTLFEHLKLSMYAHLDYVYGCAHTKPFLLIEFCQKCTFDTLLARELVQTLTDQEAHQLTVTLIGPRAWCFKWL